MNGNFKIKKYKHNMSDSDKKTDKKTDKNEDNKIDETINQVLQYVTPVLYASKPIIFRSIIYPREFKNFIQNPISSFKDISLEAIEIYIAQKTIQQISTCVEDYIPSIITNQNLLKYTTNCIYPLTSLAIIGANSWKKGKFKELSVPQAILDTIENSIYYNITSISDYALSNSETLLNINNYIFDCAINYVQNSIENETLSNYALKSINFIKSTNPIIGLSILGITRGFKEIINYYFNHSNNYQEIEKQKKQKIMLIQEQEKKEKEEINKKISILTQTYKNSNISREDKLHCENKLLQYGVIDTKISLPLTNYDRYSVNKFYEPLYD